VRTTASFLRCGLGAAVLVIFLLAGATVADAAQLKLSTLSPRQGQTVQVTATVSPGESLPPLKFNGRVFPLFPLDSSADQTGKYQGLLPIAADLNPGTYSVSFGEQRESVKVLSGKFPVQRLSLPKSKDNFIASPGEKEAVQKAKSTVSEEQMWTGLFMPPTKARISALFGYRRIVNGRLLKDYFHSGMDFAAPVGTPVKAAAPGKVLIAATGWRLHGNTVAIDHGQGVVSFSIHLQKVLVKKGDLVKAGQVIGKVGQTGRASGPHLHFSLYVNETATNPADWFRTLFGATAIASNR
jgi:murein DD-endopeptidase MepM/ murein hydrolase activator NlpD